jgi:hypothetical protein
MQKNSCLSVFRSEGCFGSPSVIFGRTKGGAGNGSAFLYCADPRTGYFRPRRQSGHVANFHPAFSKEPVKSGGKNMIIVLKPECSPEQAKAFAASLEKEYGVQVNIWFGTQSTVLGLIGDTSSIDIDSVAAQDCVESVKRVQEPYKKANRKFHPDDTVVTLPGGQKIGGGGGCAHRRAVFGRVAGTDLRSRAPRQGGRGAVPPRRSFQAAHLALLVSGDSGPRGSTSSWRQKRRPACPS